MLDYVKKAKEILKDKGFISMALLVRKLKINFDMAERIMNYIKKETNNE